jgi:GNAT superfamily N-acetyltransferase
VGGSDVPRRPGSAAAPVAEDAVLGPVHRPGGAGVLDGLVERVLGGCRYRFTVANGPEERSVAYRFPDGLETDEFDAVAVHVLGWDGPDPVCTGRLVLPPRPLPTEQACGLIVEPRGLVVDVGRMAVLRAHQSFGHGTFVALLCRLYREMRATGHEVACGMMAAPARSLLTRLGLRLEELGPERPHHGQLRAPVRFSLTANVAPLARTWRGADHGGPRTRQASTPPKPKEFDNP